MTYEEKELLLKDLCARLLYDFFVHRYSDNANIRIDNIGTFSHFLEYSECEYFKPYLRPMSSMTEEEHMKLKSVYDNGTNGLFDEYSHIDWLNAHHFDYRGLIDKGLALEAPEGMYNLEKK